MLRDLMKPLASFGTTGAPPRLAAPAPVPLSRLYPLDTLIALRDQAARNVAMYTRQAQQLANRTAVKSPTLATAKPAVQPLEEPASPQAELRRPLIGS